MRYEIHMCKCDKCGKETQLQGTQALPERWSLIFSTNGRTEQALNSGFRNYATVCDACHSSLFGDFWSSKMSSNGGIEYILR